MKPEPLSFRRRIKKRHRSPEAWQMDGFPLFFRPILKRAIWGGRALGEELGKAIGDLEDYAESWEVVDHGSDQSVVDESRAGIPPSYRGEFVGKTLGELVSTRPRWLLGGSWEASSHGGARFPLLLKYLDCNRVLSVQVHPDDVYAAKMSPPDSGKTEAWYVVEATRGSRLYAGLKPGVGRAELSEAVRERCVEEVLHAFEPSAGDCIFIPAGTVHAIGGGLLIAEIQQSSDTTFRLSDWGRVGADGRPRQLHVEESIEVADYASGPVSPVRPRGLGHSRDGREEPLVSCDSFELRVVEGGSVGSRPAAANGLELLTVPSGSAELYWEGSSGGGESCRLARGESVLLPAAMGAARITPSADGVVLRMSLPSSDGVSLGA